MNEQFIIVQTTGGVSGTFATVNGAAIQNNSFTVGNITYGIAYKVVNGAHTDVVLTVTGVAQAVNFVVIAAPSPVVAGPGNETVTVEAVNSSGAPTSGYTGTFTLTSSDPLFTSQSGLTLTNGYGTFPGTLETAGNQTFTATDNETSGNIGSATSNVVTVTPAAPAKLGFKVQPTSGVPQETITPAVKVAVEDTYGNVVTTNTSSVTVVLLNANGAALAGTVTQTAVAGVSTFNDLTVSLPGTGYQLEAVDDSLTPATSSPFNMTSVVTATAVAVAPSASSVTYGTQVTFTANVTATTGSAAPTGSVDFYNTTTHTDLGLGTSAGAAGAVATWTFTTGVKTFNVTAGDTITASFTPGTGSTWEAASSNTVVETVTAAAITVTAAIQTKTYDGTTAATAVPSITSTAGLVGGDTATFSEVYGLKNAGSETLIPTGTISDGNSGKNYSVTYTNIAGSISKLAITVTATSQTKATTARPPPRPCPPSPAAPAWSAAIRRRSARPTSTGTSAVGRSRPPR